MYIVRGTSGDEHFRNSTRVPMNLILFADLLVKALFKLSLVRPSRNFDRGICAPVHRSRTTRCSMVENERDRRERELSGIQSSSK